MTEHIPAILTHPSARRVACLSQSGRLTKAGLKRALDEGILMEFISQSVFHRHGSYFMPDEAVDTIGRGQSVSVEVRDQGTLTLVGVIEYSRDKAGDLQAVLR